MTIKLRRILPTTLAIVILDHLTKWWIDSLFAVGTQRSIIPGFFDLVHYRNTGAAFGFLADSHPGFRVPFFYVTSFLALCFIVYYIVKLPNTAKGAITALALVLGGAIGNITDRIWRSSVVDFLSFHWHDAVWRFSFIGNDVAIPLSWPAFNIADSAITCGVIWLLIATWQMPNKTSEKD